jgi:hypothetical protein
MGRGRQKAMAKKVAREIKYFSQDTDYDALTNELSAKKDQELEDYLNWAKRTADECNNQGES